MTVDHLERVYAHEFEHSYLNVYIIEVALAPVEHASFPLNVEDAIGRGAGGRGVNAGSEGIGYAHAGIQAVPVGEDGVAEGRGGQTGVREGT